MSRREISVDFTHNIDGPMSGYSYTAEPNTERRPFTPIEALMSAAPHEPIETSQIELLAMRDLLADAIDRLPERHKWVLEMQMMRRTPVRPLGDMMSLSKSRVWKIKQEALAMLRNDLQDHPLIVAYLGRHDILNDEE